jgi:hypothetical protein
LRNTLSHSSRNRASERSGEKPKRINKRRTEMKIKDVLFNITLGLLVLGAGIATSHAATIVFQEGAEITVDGVGTGVFYAGTHDTYIFNGNANAVHGSQHAIYLDDFPCCTDALMRFDNIFGPGVGQIPVGTVITSASLEKLIIDAGTAILFGEIHTDQPWDQATATWNSVLGGNGVTFGTDTTLLGVGIPENTGGWHATDVTVSLSAWSLDPLLNNGWGWKPDGGNTGLMAFRTSEVPAVGARPKLSVTFDTIPSAAAVTANLTALLGDPGLDPAAAIAIEAALATINGKNGVVAKLADGKTGAALANVVNAILDLEDAEAADPTLDLTAAKATLTAVARTAALSDVDQARSVDPGHNKVAAADQLIVDGDFLRDAGNYVDAVTSYKQAANKVKKLLP